MVNRILGSVRNLIDNPVPTMISLLAILIALSVHEWGHAYSAYRLGDPTARNLGRMTINPMRHIDPIGLLSMLFFGFGWAKPVPVNPRNFSHYRRDDIIVSLSGITMNFIMAFCGLLLFSAAIAFDLFTMSTASTYIFYFLTYFCYINLALMVFNLIPIPPLDGSHVLESLLIRKTGPAPFLFLQRYGFIILLGLIVTDITSTIIGAVAGFIWRALLTLFGAVFGIPYLSSFSI